MNKQEARVFLHHIMNDVLEIVFGNQKTVGQKGLLALTCWILTEIMDKNGGTDD